MGVFGMGPMEWGIVLVIVLLLFGPSQLPKLAKTFGKATKSLREGLEGKMEDEDEAEDEQKPAKAEKAEAAAKAPEDEE